MALTTARRQRYRIDLPSLHADCEANYLRLLKLLPDMATEDRRQLALWSGDDRERRFQIAVTERSRYTATLEVTEFSPRLPWGMSASFTVRAYHDARMAEVLSFQQHRQRGLPVSSLQPYQPDEKAQWNRVLGEWLMHCLAHGYSIEPVFLPDSSGEGRA